MQGPPGSSTNPTGATGATGVAATGATGPTGPVQTGNVTFNSMTVTGAIPSTSSDTGSIVVAGGVGISGAINIGGDFNTSGSVTIGVGGIQFQYLMMPNLLLYDVPPGETGISIETVQGAIVSFQGVEFAPQDVTTVTISDSVITQDQPLISGLANMASTSSTPDYTDFQVPVFLGMSASSAGVITAQFVNFSTNTLYFTFNLWFIPVFTTFM